MTDPTDEPGLPPEMARAMRLQALRSMAEGNAATLAEIVPAWGEGDPTVLRATIAQERFERQIREHELEDRIAALESFAAAITGWAKQVRDHLAALGIQPDDADWWKRDAPDEDES